MHTDHLRDRHFGKVTHAPDDLVIADRTGAVGCNNAEHQLPAQYSQTKGELCRIVPGTDGADKILSAPLAPHQLIENLLRRSFRMSCPDSFESPPGIGRILQNHAQ